MRISDWSSDVCSSDLRRPCVDTRSFTPLPSASESSVTFCKLGRKVRLVLLFAWLTLWPTWRPLPVSSQMRDMSSVLTNLGGVPVAARGDIAKIGRASGRERVCQYV